jgi:hypothetical protein
MHRVIHTISVSGRTAPGGVIGTIGRGHLVIPLDPGRKTLRIAPIDQVDPIKSVLVSRR